MCDAYAAGRRDGLTAALRETHHRCDCTPDLGPAHCRLCSLEAGTDVTWQAAPCAPAAHDRAVRAEACEHLQHLRGHDIEQEYVDAVIEGGVAEPSDNEAELRYIQRVRSMMPSPAAVRMLDEHEAEVRGRIETEGGGR